MNRTSVRRAFSARIVTLLSLQNLTLLLFLWPALAAGLDSLLPGWSGWVGAAADRLLP